MPAQQASPCTPPLQEHAFEQLQHLLRRNNFEVKGNLRVPDILRAASSLSHLRAGVLTTQASLNMLRGLAKVVAARATWARMH